MILIPGFASGAWTWFCQIEDLSKDFQVITFDPRGIGRSKTSDDGLQNLLMETFVADVAQILDNLKIKQANVLGASFGGFVAQEFALEFPERIDKLIPACTTAGGKNHVAPDAIFPAWRKIRRFIRPAFTDEYNREHAAEVEKVCRLREQNEVADAVYSAQLSSAFSLVLSNGKNVAPALVKENHLVSQCFVSGDGKNYCVALITLNQAEVSAWAKSGEIEFADFADLIKNELIYNSIEKTVAKVNAKVSSSEQIKKFVILERDFSAEADGVTPTLKLKRSVISANFRELTASFYE